MVGSYAEKFSIGRLKEGRLEHRSRSAFVREHVTHTLARRNLRVVLRRKDNADVMVCDGLVWGFYTPGQRK
jgi:hypothetical protein